MTHEIPSVSHLYCNSTQMIKDLKLRDGLGKLIEEASPDELCSLIFIVTGQRWSQNFIEMDLGSLAIETLLDCISHSDHHQLHDIKGVLQSQGVQI